MRPALLRLLKRPSAISLLNDLVSTSSGIEHFRTPGKCIACQRRRSHAKPLPLDRSVVVQQTNPPHELQFHDIIINTDHKTSAHSTRPEDVIRKHTVDSLPLSLDVDQLEIESALSNKSIKGSKRLVDDLKRKHDFELWKDLLQYRKRRYGNKGVVEILKGLVDRVDDIQLPVNGKLADYFWETFVNAGLEDEQALCDIAEYAEIIWTRAQRRWDRFYEVTVGGLFAKGLPVQAVFWHRKLQAIHLKEPNDIILVIPQALSCIPQQPPDWSLFSREAVLLGYRAGLRAFGEICLTTEGHQMYEDVISFLLRGGHSLDALYMHEFLLKRKDFPRDPNTVGQLIAFAETESHTFSRKVRERIRAIKPSLLSFRDSLATSNSTEGLNGIQQSEATENTAQPKDDEDVWIKEKTFKDGFGARLFATKALTVDMITNGLQMFGVQAIGPLSLREIALRADGPRDVLEKIQALRKANITIRDCAYTRLVERLATEHKDIVLEDLLQSDQHPDALEDTALQEDFLCSYLMARDWRLYNLTKAILSDVAKDDIDNIQFRVYLTAENWLAASDIVDKMYLVGKTLSEHSINHMVHKILSPRLPGRAQPYARDAKLNEVGYVTRILKLAYRSSVEIDPQYWIELLQRLGKHRHIQWDQLRGLCLWLAQNYVVREDSPYLYSLSRSTGIDPDTLVARNRTQLRHIFNPRLQMALVAWGFRLPLWSEEVHEMPGTQDEGGMVIHWLRGLLLLRELEALGVTVYPSFVRMACRERLQVLYGELYSTQKWNRTLRQNNTIKPSRILGDMLKIYPSLFTEEDIANVHKMIDQPLSGMATRRMQQQLDWLQQWH